MPTSALAPTPAQTRAGYSPLVFHWNITRDLVFLNHGSFGAVPRDVRKAQDAWRDRVEAEPVKFFVEDLFPAMDAARKALAAFVRCRPQDLVLIPNATIAVATILQNIQLNAGDEILINDHEYPACCNSVRRLAARTGAKVVCAPLPFPAASSDQVAEAILKHVTPRTRLALLSHVTSPSAFVLPIARLVGELEARGVRTLVDGAHTPGFLPDLDVNALGASYYTANCHKWICAPKGSAFLWVREDLQKDFRPLALSNYAEKPKPGRSFFLTEFDYVGSLDYSPLLCIPDAIACMGSMVPGGWGEVMRLNRELALTGLRILCQRLGVEPPVPEEMLGPMATIILPAHDPERARRLCARPSRYHDALQDALIDRHRIQVPVWCLPDGRRLLRISAQLYNTPGQYELLAEAVAEELARERAL